MGNNLSRRNQGNNVPSTISYFTNSFGLYFGPYFIMNRNENRNTNARNLINEQVQNNIMTGTGLLWADLLEAIENGVITEQELSDFGISFGQTQISEYDAPITIQSLINLHKHTIKVAKVEYGDKDIRRNSNNSTSIKRPSNYNDNDGTNKENIEPKNDECVIQIDQLTSEYNYCNNKNCRVTLEFEYDSYTPCQVHLFWNAREVIVKNGNERRAIYLLNHNESRNSMTIGPLPAGNNQKFVLPAVIDIPADVVDDIVKQTNEFSVDTSRKGSVNGDISSISNNNTNNENHEVNAVNINIEPSSNTIANFNNDDSPSNVNNNPIDPNASSSTVNPNNQNNQNPNDDGASTRTRRITRIGRNMFSRSRSSSRSTSRTRASIKKDAKEKKIVWYPLIIVLESLEKKDEKVDDRAIKYQTTLVKLEISNETNQYNIKSVDQKVMIKNNLYRLQEIYGFTDITDADEAKTNEVNTSIECVICLSEPRNTIVLPCRHLCVCQDCADILCNQSRHDRRSNYLSTPRCPICRQVFHSFLRINMDYFNSTDDLSRASSKGKKNDYNSTEKKYDIIATRNLDDDELEEEEEEEQQQQQQSQSRESSQPEEQQNNEPIEEYKEREKEEDYDKSIFEDVNNGSSSNSHLENNERNSNTSNNNNNSNDPQEMNEIPRESSSIHNNNINDQEVKEKSEYNDETKNSISRDTSGSNHDNNDNNIN